MQEMITILSIISFKNNKNYKKHKKLTAPSKSSVNLLIKLIYRKFFTSFFYTVEKALILSNLIIIKTFISKCVLPLGADQN